MMVVALLMLGLLAGLVITFLVLGALMNKPSARIWLANHAHFSRSRPPEDCEQLVRHGKWVAPRHLQEES